MYRYRHRNWDQDPGTIPGELPQNRHNRRAIAWQLFEKHNLAKWLCFGDFWRIGGDQNAVRIAAQIAARQAPATTE